MKIVIDINEMVYDWLKNGYPDEKDGEYAISIISNGTPLPKGHGDLKDMGNLKYVFDLTREDPTYSGKDIERAINSMKTIIPAESEEENEISTAKM